MRKGEARREIGPSAFLVEFSGTHSPVASWEWWGQKGQDGDPIPSTEDSAGGTF